MIELKGVSKQYLYGAKVLNVLDAKINDGEFLAVIGDNGSGKTTFLKLIAGVTNCEGQVTIDGIPITSKTDDVIMLFDDLALDKNRSVYYNISRPLVIRKMDKDKINEKVENAAATLGIVSILNMRVSKINNLEKALCAFARLLIRPAKVLIIDDVTARLNVIEKAEFLKITQPILYSLKKSGITIIYSSSDSYEAVALSDRVLVLHDGKVKQLGTVDEIYNNPQNIWACESLDPDYNMFKARLGLRDGHKILDFNIDDIDMVLNADCFKGDVVDKYITREVIVGCHPEDFLCDKEIEKLGIEKNKVIDDVVFQKRVNNKNRKYTKRGFNIDSNDNLDVAYLVPNIEKCIIFDHENENSILRMVR